MMKGADRFMAYTLSASAQCWAVAIMASGDTVMKNPALYISFAFSTTAQLSGCFTWSTCAAERKPLEHPIPPKMGNVFGQVF